MSDLSSEMLHPELTLIVAATRNMGIGLNGTLPWTGLKKEMAYFARVTKRVPTLPSPASAAATNAVIMGRKTWDSISPKFRPLKGRLNIVISRSHLDHPPQPLEETQIEGPVKVKSLEDALTYLKSAPGTGKAFIIGGAQIYDAALQLPATKRVLLTRIQSPDFKCDTFFPLELDEKVTNGWARKSKDELDTWTGEAVPEGIQEENETRYEFQLWERVG